MLLVVPASSPSGPSELPVFVPCLCVACFLSGRTKLCDHYFQDARNGLIYVGPTCSYLQLGLTIPADRRSEAVGRETSVLFEGTTVEYHPEDHHTCFCRRCEICEGTLIQRIIRATRKPSAIAVVARRQEGVNIEKFGQSSVENVLSKALYRSVTQVFHQLPRSPHQQIVPHAVNEEVRLITINNEFSNSIVILIDGLHKFLRSSKPTNFGCLQPQPLA